MPGSPSPTEELSCGSSTSAPFGGMALSDLTDDGVPETIAHIAPDPLEADFDQVGVVRRMKSRDSAVKRALLDQTLVSGVGNIYADEALWRAQVHGERLCSELTRPALSRLLDHAREVMLEALGRAGPASTRSTSTSTARRGTSTARSTPTARRVGPAPGAALPSGASRS